VSIGWAGPAGVPEFVLLDKHLAVRRAPGDLSAPGVIAAEIVVDVQAALAEFAELAESLQSIGVGIEDVETGQQRTGRPRISNEPSAGRRGANT